MRISQGKNSLFYKDVLDIMSEEAILKYYFNVTQIPCVINSPLRKDKNPSFQFYYGKEKEGIFYADLANSSVWGGIPNLLLKYFNFSNYDEVISLLIKDKEHIQSVDKTIIKSIEINRRRKRTVTNRKIEVKVRKWEKHDLDYWQESGINKEWLKKGNIYPISHFSIGYTLIRAEKYAYVYVERKDNKVTLKVYQPFSKKLKWLSNHDSSVWDLWPEIMKASGDDLIITSSRKDALSLWSNLEIPSTSLQAESVLPKKQVVEELFKKFKNIYCLYDNDYDKETNHGKNLGEKLSKLYGFIPILIPREYEAKDASDLYKKVGENKFKEIIIQLLKN